MQIDSFLSVCTKLKSKWIKDPHIKPDTLKLIEEKVGEEPQIHGHRGNFPEQNTNDFCSNINNTQMGLQYLISSCYFFSTHDHLTNCDQQQPTYNPPPPWRPRVYTPSEKFPEFQTSHNQGNYLPLAKLYPTRA